ncbi:MAG TPA: DUF2264 domain-containing protein [Arenibaculum sp.]|nr:DUF2264 domain-containing protein [Arenibaculum sp.]
MNRRRFFASTLGAAAASTVRVTGSGGRQPAPDATRDRWVAWLRRVAEPVLVNLADGTLRARMPVEQAAGATRAGVTHLEALGRLLAGIAPWLEGDDGSADEQALRVRYRTLVHRGLAQALDPAGPDRMNFTEGGQPLVDAAFLAEALLRAPRTLQEMLAPDVRARLVTAFESARAIQPGFNNWLLFAATVEAALKQLGARWDRMRVDYALRQHDQWYVGDGAYSDGPMFHWDYYGSFVIHPMLLDVLDACADQHPAWTALQKKEEARAARYAAVLERMIAPDGSFPPLGRSIVYRCGAFHALAQAAWRRRLPAELVPPQAREALTAGIAGPLDAAGTFDDQGWLRIGLGGHQPGLGERYISTGSLYLCASAFLPLGLPPSDPFWASAPVDWTGKRAWAGAPVPIDKAMTEG